MPRRFSFNDLYNQDGSAMKDMDVNREEFSETLPKCNHAIDVCGDTQQDLQGARTLAFPYVFENPRDFMVRPVQRSQHAAEHGRFRSQLGNGPPKDPRQAVYDAHNSLLLSGHLNVGHQNLLGATGASLDYTLQEEPEIPKQHDCEYVWGPSQDSIYQLDSEYSRNSQDGSSDCSSEIALQDFITGRYTLGPSGNMTWKLNSYRIWQATNDDDHSHVETNVDDAVARKKHSKFLNYVKKKTKSLCDFITGRRQL
ncbi:hypothetical protein EDC01DRAFT_634150 [Geopyxis carbonaria]|nr:hypothetical protein EDC01DRAFT_634150 [Geopyxis carbonaria]